MAPRSRCYSTTRRDLLLAEAEALHELRDDVDEIVLDVLRDARDERDADGRAEQQADAAEELAGRVFLEPGRVLVDDGVQG